MEKGIKIGDEDFLMRWKTAPKKIPVIPRRMPPRSHSAMIV